MIACGFRVRQISEYLKIYNKSVIKAIPRSKDYSLTSRCSSTTGFEIKPVNGKRSCIPHEAQLFSKDEMIEIRTTSRIMKFPWLWLRDNCQCKNCFNPQMQSRTIDWKFFDTSVCPENISIRNNELHVLWSDGHESQYFLQWLQEREFTNNVQVEWLQNTYRPPKIPWDAESFPQIQRKFKYKEVMEKDDCLLTWLETLAIFGIAIIEDTPSKEDQLRKLANRIAFIKKTHYGEEFVVRNKPDTTNLAYLAVPLQMHTDMPYYDYKPGVNMLHCLQQTTEGGENQFTDGLNISQLLKKKDPETYKILSTVPVEWSDIGEESQKFHTIFRAPVICENHLGEFMRVNYNQWQRDSHFSVSLDQVKSWYKANGIFTQALYDTKNMIQFKTRPGDIVTFDNIRLVHGRSGYTDTENNERHIIGSYLDWDVVYSRIRILRKEQKKI